MLLTSELFKWNTFLRCTLNYSWSCNSAHTCSKYFILAVVLVLVRVFNMGQVWCNSSSLRRVANFEERETVASWTLQNWSGHMLRISSPRGKKVTFWARLHHVVEKQLKHTHAHARTHVSSSRARHRLFFSGSSLVAESSSSSEPSQSSPLLMGNM